MILESYSKLFRDCILLNNKAEKIDCYYKNEIHFGKILSMSFWETIRFV